jgi:hypothetical protein
MFIEVMLTVKDNFKGIAEANLPESCRSTNGEIIRN